MKHCSKCKRIWTLDTSTGICPWCGRLAVAETRRQLAVRVMRSRFKTRPVTVDYLAEYQLLTDRWAYWFKIASTYSKRVPTDDRQDTLHDIMLELAKAERRDGRPLPELRAYRIASLMIALYWRKRNLGDKPVCIYNGLPQQLHCSGCRAKAGEPCAWRAIRPILYLENGVTDEDGHEAELKDLVADDSAIDLDAWLDARTFISSCPVRLVEIARLVQSGKRLTTRDQVYLWRYKKQAQKSLF